MQGHRDPSTTLYMINTTAPLKSMMEQKIPDAFSANHVYETKSKQELILFYHAACFSPTKRTSVKAIKRNAFASWPRLTTELVNKYLQWQRNYQGTYPTALQRHAINQTETGGPHHDSTKKPRDPNKSN